MYTEEEALKQLCPLVRPLKDGTCLCRGSDCMMWRWPRPLYRVTPNPVGSTSQAPPEQVQINIGQGYCGLAGKPDQ